MVIDIFDKVFKMSISATIVICIILIIRYFLKSSPKIYSYLLWGVVLVRLLAPNSIESDFGILPNGDRFVEKNIISDDYTVEVNETGIGINVSENNATSESQKQEEIENSNPLNTAASSNINSNIPVTEEDTKSSVSDSTFSFDTSTKVLSVFWVIGVIFLLAKSFIELEGLKKTLCKAELYKENIYFSDNISTAFVLGIIKPKIYVPKGLNESAIEYIVKHEKIHIKRKDPLFRFFGFLALCIHWFNPIVWFAFSKSGEDMEMSCDERVIKDLGYSIKKDYTSSLLALATTGSKIKAVPLAFAEQDTKTRVQNVLNYKKPKFWIVAGSISVVIVTTIILLTSQKGYFTLSDIELSPLKVVGTIENIEIKVYDEIGSSNRTIYKINEDKIDYVFSFLKNIQFIESIDDFQVTLRYFIEVDYFDKDLGEISKLAYGFSDDFRYVYIYENFQLRLKCEVAYPKEVQLFFEKLQSDELTTVKHETVVKNLGSEKDVLWYTREEYKGNIEEFEFESAWILPLSKFATNSNFEETNKNNIKGLYWEFETVENFIDIPELYQSVRYIFLLMPEIEELQVSAKNTKYGYTNTYSFTRERFEQIYGDNKKVNIGTRRVFNDLIDDILNTDYYITDVYKEVENENQFFTTRVSYPLSEQTSSTYSIITTYPKDFPANIATAQNTFVVNGEDVYNKQYFDEFVSAVENQHSAHLYRTSYTAERAAIVTEIIYNDSHFNVIVDSRRDGAGKSAIIDLTYKNLVEYIPEKNKDIIYYYLTDNETLSSEDLENGVEVFLVYKYDKSKNSTLKSVLSQLNISENNIKNIVFESFEKVAKGAIPIDKFGEFITLLEQVEVYTGDNMHLAFSTDVSEIVTVELMDGQNVTFDFFTSNNVKYSYVKIENGSENIIVYEIMFPEEVSSYFDVFLKSM